jgi:uncharacterized integral membrane protein (TIGR00698 family)
MSVSITVADASPDTGRAVARGLGPGLATVTAAVCMAFAIARLVPAINASTAAVVLGAVLTNARLHRPALYAGTRFAGHRLLRIAIVLLGLQLSMPELIHLGGRGLAVVVVTVAITFTGTRWLGKRLGISPARSLLIATGFSICGASAVAAMEPVADGDEEDTAIAIALVTLCGSLAILVLPLLRVPLALDVSAFGSWVGASVHDVGQTVATANRVPGSLTTAVVVKLTRVVLLAPLVAVVSLSARRKATAHRAATHTGPEHTGPAHSATHRPPPIPLFVAGFLVAVLLASIGILPEAALRLAKDAQGILLAAALFGLGTGIYLPALLRTGRRPLVLGLTAWLLIATVAWIGVRLAA